MNSYPQDHVHRGEQINPRKLFVGGFSRQTTQRQFRKYWKQFGQVDDCIVMTDADGNSRGFGFVEFASEAIALDVLSRASSLKLHGKRIDVQPAVPASKRDARCTNLANDDSDLNLKTPSINVTHTKCPARPSKPPLHHAILDEHSENEGEPGSNFNFNAWVADNGLTAMKHGLIKHGLNTAATISRTSDAFQHFMCDADIVQNKVHLLPALFSAIDKIAQSTPVTAKVQYKRIIVSEEEHTVIDTIQSNLSELDKMQSEAHRLFAELPESESRSKQQKISQIQAADSKMTKIFDEIESEVQKTKQKFVDGLNNINAEVRKNDEMMSDDRKELETWADAISAMHESKQYLQRKLRSCNDKIESMDNDQRVKRKQDIVEIGNEVNKQFNDSMKEWKRLCDETQRAIDENNAETHIDFVLNEKGRQRVISDLRNIGVIVHDATEPNARPKPDHFPLDDDKTCILARDLQRQLAEKEKDIQQKDTQIASLQKQVADLLQVQFKQTTKTNDTPDCIQQTEKRSKEKEKSATSSATKTEEHPATKLTEHIASIIADGSVPSNLNKSCRPPPVKYTKSKTKQQRESGSYAPRRRRSGRQKRKQQQLQTPVYHDSWPTESEEEPPQDNENGAEWHESVESDW